MSNIPKRLTHNSVRGRRTTISSMWRKHAIFAKGIPVGRAGKSRGIGAVDPSGADPDLRYPERRLRVNGLRSAWTSSRHSPRRCSPARGRRPDLPATRYRRSPSHLGSGHRDGGRKTGTDRQRGGFPREVFCRPARPRIAGTGAFHAKILCRAGGLITPPFREVSRSLAGARRPAEGQYL